MEIHNNLDLLKNQILNIIYSEGTGITIGDDNTINVKIASTSEKGIVQFATDDEVTTGTATDKVITPKQLKDSLPIILNSKLCYLNPILYVTTLSNDKGKTDEE